MNQEESTEQKEVNQSLGNIGKYIRNLFVVQEVDFVHASQNIRSDVSFRGFNIWILVSSILICSLGLNLNSTAIVIGAMLISPLMGPINGIGLAIGTYDRLLLRKSFINLGVATVVSILTAFIFFKITPTGKDVHELFSRKTPIILDLFVAFFGGLAGILAASRCIQNNVVPGVAIATALMPPLCTAGYGLATGQMDYFLGAFYLFFMNVVMISLAAVIIVVYLRYPKYSFVNDKTKKRVRAAMLGFVILLSIPSIVLYYNLLKEGKVDQSIQDFVESELHSNSSIYVDNFKRIDNDSTKIIQVSIKGKYLEDDEITLLQNKLAKHHLSDYKLIVVQSGKSGIGDDDLVNISEKFKVDVLSDLYEKNQEQLENKDDEIQILQTELKRLSIHSLAVDKLAKLARSQFDVEEVAMDNLIYFNKEKQDTVTTVLVKWKDELDKIHRAEQLEKMKALFKIQLELKELLIYEIN